MLYRDLNVPASCSDCQTCWSYQPIAWAGPTVLGRRMGLGPAWNAFVLVASAGCPQLEISAETKTSVFECPKISVIGWQWAQSVSVPNLLQPCSQYWMMQCSTCKRTCGKLSTCIFICLITKTMLLLGAGKLSADALPPLLGQTQLRLYWLQLAPRLLL